MKKLVAIFALMLSTATSASAITWDNSPNGNALAFSATVVNGVGQVNFLDTQSQPQGIFGAGFTMSGTSAGVKFDADLKTWDSYNATNGYYDAFIVTISTLGYYWNLPHVDPIASNASTFVWGGNNWTDGKLESYNTAPGGYDIVSLTSAVPTTFYVSFVLDTSTLPFSDTAHPSYGSFHVAPVPEPGTMMLLGMGLLGLAIYGKRRMNREA